MNTDDFRFSFDLQLFAEEGSGGPAPAEGGETAGGGEGAQGGSILGSQPPAGGGETAGGGEAAQGTNAAVPDVYDFSSIVPEGMTYDEGAARDFGNLARECGLTQDQAAKVAGYGLQFARDGVSAAMQQIAATQAKWGDDARAQLGADFDKTVSQAAVGIDRLSQSIPNFRAMLDETGAGNRIEMIQFMAAVGAMVGEDPGHGVPGYGGQKSLYPNTDFRQYK